MGGVHLAKAPLALAAVRRIDVLFDVERALNGLPEARRLVLRKEHAAPLAAELEARLRHERPGSPDTTTSPRR